MKSVININIEIEGDDLTPLNWDDIFREEMKKRGFKLHPVTPPLYEMERK